MSLSMKELWGSSHISAGHAAYLESLYETFINNPEDSTCTFSPENIVDSV